MQPSATDLRFDIPELNVMHAFNAHRPVSASRRAHSPLAPYERLNHSNTSDWTMNTSSIGQLPRFGCMSSTTSRT